MSANAAPEIHAPPQPQPRRRIDLAVLRVQELLAKHPEYSSVECLIALSVALHMGRKADGFYHATLKQTDAGVLVKEARASRRTVQRALRKLCASGGIFKAVPRYGAVGRLANDYVLIEAPKLYNAQRSEGGAAVVEFAPAKPKITAADRQAAQALCEKYARWYRDLRGVPYEPCPLDAKHALLLVREFGQFPEYLSTLLCSWLDRNNDRQLEETYKLPEAYKARLLYQSRPYLKLIHREWADKREEWVPPELLTVGA